MGNNIHDGHRKRMRERFKEVGFDGFSDYNVVEMLLFYSQSRKDTNELAHKLLDEFHSLPELLEADYESLVGIEGVGENTAVLLKLIPAISRRYMEESSLPKQRIVEPSDAAGYLMAKYMYETKEIAYALFLSSSGRIISCKRISEGVVNGTELSVRQLVETAVKSKASGVIISHNHPHGVAAPSKEDEKATPVIKKALGLVDITLLDHIIVAGNTYCSFVNLGIM